MFYIIASREAASTKKYWPGGKSTIARQLAEKLDWDFFDADDFHPPENIFKMKSGIPLDDSEKFYRASGINDGRI